MSDERTRDDVICIKNFLDQPKLAGFLDAPAHQRARDATNRLMNRFVYGQVGVAGRLPNTPNQDEQISQRPPDNIPRSLHDIWYAGREAGLAECALPLSVADRERALRLAERAGSFPVREQEQLQLRAEARRLLGLPEEP